MFSVFEYKIKSILVHTTSLCNNTNSLVLTYFTIDKCKRNNNSPDFDIYKKRNNLYNNNYTYNIMKHKECVIVPSVL